MCKKEQGEVIDSSHVVRWLLEQTCCSNEQLQNLYLAQGTDFCRRMDAQWVNDEYLSNKGDLEAYLNVIRNPDQRTLEQLYGGAKINKASFLTSPSFAVLKGFKKELDRQRQAANYNGNNVLGSVLEEVEQEREVEFQQEEIRQVQKQKDYKALAFPGLHRNLSYFAETGNLLGEQGYVHAFAALSLTGIGRKFNICQTKSRFFVSTQFLRTVELGKKDQNDNFLVSFAPTFHPSLRLC